MSISFNGNIYDKNVSIENVFEVIQKKIDPNAKLCLYEDWNGNPNSHFTSSCVDINFNGKKRNLSLFDYIHANSPREKESERYIWLSLGADNDAKTIITSIVKEFGGTTTDERSEETKIVSKTPTIDLEDSFKGQKVFIYDLNSENEIVNKLNRLISKGWYINSECHTKAGDTISCIIVANK